jgi:hypothetical protein
MDSILSLHLEAACALDTGVDVDAGVYTDVDVDAADEDVGGLDTGLTDHAFGESCHSWASREMPMTLPPLSFVPFGLSGLSSSPASSFAAFAPAPVASGSPATSAGFFPPLAFSSLSMAAF